MTREVNLRGVRGVQQDILGRPRLRANGTVGERWTLRREIVMTRRESRTSYGRKERGNSKTYTTKETNLIRRGMRKRPIEDA